MESVEDQRALKELIDGYELRHKLADLKGWEQTMKQREKDLKISNKVENTTNECAPIRSKGEKKENPEKTPTTTAAVTMNGGGVDVPHLPTLSPAPTGDGDSNCQNELERLRTERAIKEAQVEKELGNKLVSAKDYSRAIPHYTRAIKLNPSDPAFFLNRALCRLRLEEFEPAIADCDAALNLDNSLVKAYFRRMQSNTKLERFDAAFRDCMQMIKMEPNNTDLRKEFERIRQLKIDKEGGGRKKPPSSIALPGGGGGRKAEPEEVYWEPKPKKMWSRFGVDEEEIRFQEKAPHLRSKKPVKRVAVKETFSAPEPVETFPDHIVDKLFNNFTGESTSNGPAASTSRSPTALFSPYSPLYGSFNAKSPVIATPPSPMSSSALNLSSCDAERSLDDIFSGMSIEPKSTVHAADSLPPPLEFAQGNDNDDKTDLMKPTSSNTASPNQPVTQYSIPKTGVQFSTTWKSLDEGERFHFLRQCQEGSEIVGKLGASLDDSLFSELIDCMYSYFCPKDLNVGDLLSQLARNNEMNILSMMMGGVERQQVDDLVRYVRSRQELSEDKCREIEQAFRG